ncbi:MAG: hypothetical protein RL199_2193, partial [Pseudomonadota bacterium]
THHRHEKLAALRRDDEVRNEQQKKGESKERLQERRSERARPRLEPAAPKAEEAAAELEARPAPQPRPKPEPKPNRLYVSIGSADADEATLRTTLAGLASATPEAVLLVEQRPTHSYVEVAPDLVPAFLAVHAQEWNGKALTVEVARPPSARRRRR